MDNGSSQTDQLREQAAIKRAAAAKKLEDAREERAVSAERNWQKERVKDLVEEFYFAARVPIPQNSQPYTIPDPSNPHSPKHISIIVPIPPRGISGLAAILNEKLARERVPLIFAPNGSTDSEDRGYQSLEILPQGKSYVEAIKNIAKMRGIVRDLRQQKALPYQPSC